MPSCPSCRRPVAVARASCVYCGAPLPPAVAASDATSRAETRQAPAPAGGAGRVRPHARRDRPRARGRRGARSRHRPVSPTRRRCSPAGVGSTCTGCWRPSRPRAKRHGSPRPASRRFSCRSRRRACARSVPSPASSRPPGSLLRTEEGSVGGPPRHAADRRDRPDHPSAPGLAEAPQGRDRHPRGGLVRAPAPRRRPTSDRDRRGQLRAGLRRDRLDAARAPGLARGARRGRAARRRVSPAHARPRARGGAGPGSALGLRVSP